MAPSWSRMSAAAVVAAALAVPAAAHADGTETLGPPSVAVADRTDTVFAGVGTQQFLNLPTMLNVSVPAGATVKQVLVYWSGEDTWPGHGPDEYDDTISVAGAPVTGTLIGGPSAPFLRERFYTFRADVTARGLVAAGSNSIAVSDMDFQTELFGPTGNKGVGLVVIYDDGSASTVAGLRDGQDYAYGGFSSPYDTTAPQTFTFAPDTSTRQGSLGILAAEVLDHDLPTGVQGNVITGGFDTGQTFSLVNDLQSLQGLEYDARNFPVTIPAGARALTIQLLSQGGDRLASMLWLAGALTVDDSAPPPPPAGGEGCTPGYWKTHTEAWPPTGYSPSQALSTVFSPTGLGTLGSSTLRQALSFGGGASLVAKKQILLRAAVASVLNTAHPEISFARSTTGVVTATNTALTSGNAASVIALAEALDRDNNQGCELN
jgi:hypothetical protein